MSSTTPPAIAGYYHTVDAKYGSSQEGSNDPFPVFVPSQSTTSGTGDRQFPLDFLPGGADGGWEIADSRGSLLLLYRGVKFPYFFNAKKNAKPELVVCEPMTKQYKEVPCRPEDLKGRYKCLGLFLLRGDKTRRFFVFGGGGGTGISLSNFKVVAALLRPHCYSPGRGVPVACVFSMENQAKGFFSLFSMESEAKDAWSSTIFSVGSDWHIAKRAWGIDGIDVPSTFESFYYAGRAFGSLYWGIQGTGGPAAALVLDEATADFSTTTLPEAMLGSHRRCSFRVIGDGGDGVMRVVRLIDNDLLKVYSRIYGSDDKWAVERVLRLRDATRGLPGREDGYFQGQAVIVDAHDSYVLLTPCEKTWLFSVAVETMEVDRGHERNKYAGPAYPWELPSPVQKIWRPISRLLSCIET